VDQVVARLNFDALAPQTEDGEVDYSCDKAINGKHTVWFLRDDQQLALANEAETPRSRKAAA